MARNLTGFACPECRAQMSPERDDVYPCPCCGRAMESTDQCRHCGARTDADIGKAYGASCDRCGFIGQPVNLREEARELRAEMYADV